MSLKNTEEDLDDFLSQVDEIEQIVSGLKSTDAKAVKENLVKADRLIEKKIEKPNGINKTFINKYSDDASSSSSSCGVKSGSDQQSNQQDAFMSMMEQDAQERYARKQKSMKIANELKEKANKEYHEKNYDKAIELYSEAISHVKDNSILYTNRAQAFIIKEMHKEAISDCEWALRVDEKCIKAFIHKGRAHMFLKEFDKAATEFENARKIKCDESIAGYINQLDVCRKVHSQEISARKLLDVGERNSCAAIFEIVQSKLNKEEESVQYYALVLKTLVSLCNDQDCKNNSYKLLTVDTKTTFRLARGFEILNTHQTVRNIITLNSKPDRTTDESNLICLLFELLANVCTDCDENIKCLFRVEYLLNLLNQILDQLNTNTETVLVLKLFSVLCSCQFGKMQLSNFFDIKKIFTYLLKCNKISTSLICTSSSDILNNLISDTKIVSKISVEDLNEFVQIFVTLTPGDRLDYQNLVIRLLLSFSIGETTRMALVRNRNIWTASQNLLQNIENSEILLELIRLLINLTSTKSEFADEFGNQIFKRALSSKIIRTNGHLFAILFSNLIQKMTKNECLFESVNESFVHELIASIKLKVHSNQFVKLLTLCTMHKKESISFIIRQDPATSFLYDIFRNVSNNSSSLRQMDESLLNNAVLCMSHCVEVDKQLADKLCSTNILMDLLCLARDGISKEMRKSCGILISRLTQKNTKHLERLRELHGIEILTRSIKLV